MPKYSWVGINKFGEHQQGYFESSNENKLREFLLQEEIALLSCSLKKTGFSLSWLESIFVRKKATKEELYNFFDHLLLLLDSGVVLVDALSVVSENVSNKHFKAIIKNITVHVRKGETLSYGVRFYKNYFGELILNLIKTAEKSGNLIEALKNIVIYLETKISHISTIKQVLTTPMITLGLSFIVTLVIFIFIIPLFSDLFSSFDKPLPEITINIFAISRFLRSIWVFILFPLLAISFFLIKKILLISKVKLLKEKIMFKIPLFSRLITLSELNKFFSALSLLVNSGENLVESLKQARFTVTTKTFNQKINSVIKSIMQGGSLKESLEMNGKIIFSPAIISLISIGEKSGNIDIMIEKCSNLCKKEEERIIKLLISFLNPLLLVIVGLFITIVMLSIYIPIFNMASVL